MDYFEWVCYKEGGGGKKGKRNGSREWRALSLLRERQGEGIIRVINCFAYRR